MKGRFDALVFVVAVGAGWILASAAGVFGPRTAVATNAAPEAVASASPSMSTGRQLLEAAQSARESGEFGAADRILRQAWLDHAVRRDAAIRLRSLHTEPGFKLPVDEAAVSETLAKLGPGFQRHETQRFVILSDAPKEWTRARGALLERTHHQFFRVMDRLEYPAHPPTHKLLCVLFKDHGPYAEFAKTHDGVEAPWVAGYYASLSNRVVFYDDRTSPGFTKAFQELDRYRAEAVSMRDRAIAARRQRDAAAAETLAARAEDLDRRIELEERRLHGEASLTSEAKTIHEAVHLLAFNCGVQSRARQYPFWLTEGLATAFETDRPDAAFGPDHGAGPREEEFLTNVEQGRWFELETLVQLAAPPDRSAETADILYSQSYALMTYIYRYERAALGRYLASILEEPPGFIPAPRQLELFRAAFGDPRTIERRMRVRLAAAAR